jgi:Predicted ICC-like phosphoesterases
VLAAKRLCVQGLSFRDRSVFMDAAEALVIADVHVGRAQASDVEFPLGESKDHRRRLTDLCTAVDPDTVVIGGDVLHTFGWTTDEATESLRSLTRVCREAGAKLVLVAGNHDTVLSEAFSGDVHDQYRLSDGTVVCHGHTEPDVTADRYIIGHDHPAIEIEGVRHPCFLYGDDIYRGGDLLVLPAFTQLAAGVEVNQMRTEDFQSPLVTDADPLRPIIWDSDAEEALQFPQLGRFRRML